jgi:hypothetical protein
MVIANSRGLLRQIQKSRSQLVAGADNARIAAVRAAGASPSDRRFSRLRGTDLVKRVEIDSVVQLASKFRQAQASRACPWGFWRRSPKASPFSVLPELDLFPI